MELYVGDFQLIVIDDVSASPSHVKGLSVHIHIQVIGNITVFHDFLTLNNLENFPLTICQKLRQHFHVIKTKGHPFELCLPTRCYFWKQKNAKRVSKKCKKKNNIYIWMIKIIMPQHNDSKHKHMSQWSGNFKQSDIHTGKVWSPIARFVWRLNCRWWCSWCIPGIKRWWLWSFLPHISKNNGRRSRISHLWQLCHLLLIGRTLGRRIYTIHSIGLRLPCEWLLSNYTRTMWQNVTITRNCKQCQKPAEYVVTLTFN